ncbi:MAG: D-alanyl-D-alanine carboxypeptidase/D-alanyl-D-alanine-endopeptidase [Burkholderiales bacterium]|nr:D-alanyl-D-alanine carboxypeptidase/D-alanyl-D-alanine-endopeptidase [Burkholderiales bacterium]
MKLSIKKQILWLATLAVIAGFNPPSSYFSDTVAQAQTTQQASPKTTKQANKASTAKAQGATNQNKKASTAKAKTTKSQAPKAQTAKAVQPAAPAVPFPANTVVAEKTEKTAPSILGKVHADTTLPDTILKQVRKINLPLNDLSIVCIPLTGNGKTLSFNAHALRTPASVEKIVTSAAALSKFGPAKMFGTVLAADDEPDENGVVQGNLYLIGQGDPTLYMEKFWLLVDNLKARGVKQINGNIVVDRTRFNIPDTDPFAFDGEGNRPYNLGPDAAMVSSRSLIIKIRPDAKKGIANLYAEPALDNITIPKTIPLSRGGCGQWRKVMQPDYSNPYKPVFKGSFPSSCGNRDLLYTAFSQDEYIKAVFSALWKQSGGKWNGKVVSGKAPQKRQALAAVYSQPLTQVIYNMNKASNNIIARQLFLELSGTNDQGSKTLEGARSYMKSWAESIGVPAKEINLDNGSGLSRTSRVSAYSLARILEYMWNSPRMPEYMASLPVSGVDGTMYKRKVAQGQAHIKTGYVANARTIAGYVLTKEGHRYAVVAMVNGPAALGAIPVLDSVIDWVYTDC